MLAKESDMTAPVARWMRAMGLNVKAEFLSPWGICDLVGVRFNPSNVNKRLQLKQSRTIGSITRATLLRDIPDVESKTCTTVDQIKLRYARVLPEDIILKEVRKLVEDRFVVELEGDRIQKLNGWLPLHERLVAIELKLSRVEEAMWQARKNLGFADESYVGLPRTAASRVAATQQRWREHFDAGVGLLAVSETECEIVIPASKSPRRVDPALQLYCVEKFWRTRVKDSKT